MGILRLEIAEWYLEIVCAKDITKQLPQLIPFIATGCPEKPILCRIETQRTLSPESGAPVLTQELEGRKLSLWITPDHCFVSLKVYNTGRTYNLRTDRHWKNVITDCVPDSGDSYIALGDFIMLSFIYSSSFFHTVLIHASSISINNAGCAFIGPSGIGKSTHSRLWLQYIKGSKLLNDDQPVLRLMNDGSVYVYGSPWSGKTSCYKNEGVRLNTLFFLRQAQENQMFPLSGIQTFQKLLEATSLIRQDMCSFSEISNTLARIAERVPAYVFENLPNKDAVEQSYQFFIASRNSNSY